MDKQLTAIACAASASGTGVSLDHCQSEAARACYCKGHMYAFASASRFVGPTPDETVRKVDASM